MHIKQHLALVAMGGILVSLSAIGEPTTAPRPPRIVTAPAGFAKQTINGIRLLVMPAEETWVREAASAVKPATRPTSSPAEMGEILGRQRKTIAPQLAADLALGSDAEILKHLDEQILPAVRKVETGQPVFYYMPITDEKLTQLVKDGWDNPQFYFNRFANRVEYDPTYQWPRGAMADESVVPLIYDPKQPQGERVKALTERLAANEAARAGRVTLEGQLRIVQTLQELIETLGIKPLNLRRDQQWLGLGIQAHLTSKYAAPILGVKPEELAAQFAATGENPISPRTIDLSDPTDESILREQIRPLYQAAMQARATVVVGAWTKTKGDGVIARVLAELRKSRCADGKALVQLIKRVTEMDLTNDLKAG